MNTVVVGLGLGDEGKGKITDLLLSSGNYSVTVRYNGGANAGHSVESPLGRFHLHQLPSGAVCDHLPFLMMTNGMVVNPPALVEEILQLKQSGIDVSGRLMISDKIHCVMPWHIAAAVRKGGKIGTTKKGIGPCIADKAYRSNAIRMGNLLVSLQDEKTRRFFAADEVFHGPDLWQKDYDAAQFLRPMIGDTRIALRERMSLGQSVLFESANGIHLDIDHGTYPYVTSTGVGTAAIPQATGIPIIKFDRIVGIMKCYSTRVGEGPFLTEIFDQDIAGSIREKGKEYGTTTGRPRRIGWLDLDKTLEGVELTGATELALMHADTMYGREKIFVYHKGEYKEFQGWNHISDESFMVFCDFIVDAIKIPIGTISYGPARKDTLTFNKNCHIIM